jgi:hypothetical protein
VSLTPQSYWAEYAWTGGRVEAGVVLDTAADGRIAAVLADGYEETFSGRVLTPATVRVHRWIEPTEEPHA